MSRFLNLAMLFAATISLAGCGSNEPKLLKAKGQLIKDGKNLEPEEGQTLQVYFVPISPDGKPPSNWYAAETDQLTGAFYARGGHDKGMPPGTYRVGVEIKEERKDILKGKFNAVNSPFVFEVDDNSEPMIIDLDNPPPKS